MLRLNNVLRIEFHVFRNICDHEKIFHVTDTPRSAEDCAKLRGDDKQRITFHNTSTYFLQSPSKKFVFFSEVFLKLSKLIHSDRVTWCEDWARVPFMRFPDKENCFLLRSFIKIIKNILFRLCKTYHIVRTSPCFPGYSVSQESEWLLFSPCAYFPGPGWRVKSSQWRYPSVPPA